MSIDNNDSRTFKLVAIMIVGKSKINASGSYWISREKKDSVWAEV